MNNQIFEQKLKQNANKLIIILIVDENCDFCIAYSNLIKDVISDDKYRRYTFLIQIDQLDEPFDRYNELISNKVPSIIFLYKDEILLHKIGVLNRNQFLSKLESYIHKIIN